MKESRLDENMEPAEAEREETPARNEAQSTRNGKSGKPYRTDAGPVKKSMLSELTPKYRSILSCNNSEAVGTEHLRGTNNSRGRQIECRSFQVAISREKLARQIVDSLGLTPDSEKSNSDKTSEDTCNSTVG